MMKGYEPVTLLPYIHYTLYSVHRPNKKVIPTLLRHCFRWKASRSVRETKVLSFSAPSFSLAVSSEAGFSLAVNSRLGFLLAVGITAVFSLASITDAAFSLAKISRIGFSFDTIFKTDFSLEAATGVGFSLAAKGGTAGKGGGFSSFCSHSSSCWNKEVKQQVSN